MLESIFSNNINMQIMLSGWLRFGTDLKAKTIAILSEGRRHKTVL